MNDATTHKNTQHKYIVQVKPTKTVIHLNELNEQFSGKTDCFSSILQLTVTDTERNNFIVSNASSDSGKYVESIDHSNLTIQYHVKHLGRNTHSIRITMLFIAVGLCRDCCPVETNRYKTFSVLSIGF